jgi:glycosyltransferase involved in cell wall biosynthesis
MSKNISSDCRILCFIPTRNCETLIVKTLSCFKGEVLEYIDEILLVDNDSQDLTVQNAKKILSLVSVEKATIFQNIKNHGLGGSYKIAFKYAFDQGYDYLLVVHGDGSCDVRDLLPELRLGRYSRWDMLLSNRLALTANRKNFSTQRLIGNKIISLIASVLTWRWIPDFSSGPINLYRVSSFLTKFSNPIKNFDNTIYFANFLLLYGLYTRRDFRYFNINLDEKEKKPLHKLVQHFAKLVLILLKNLFFAKYILKYGTSGVYFGKAYKVVPVKKLQLQASNSLVSAPLESKRDAMIFYDILFPLISRDFSATTALSSLKVLLEKTEPDRCFVSLQISDIGEFFAAIDLHDYCRRVGVAVGVISEAKGELALWEKVQDAISDLSINFNPNIHSRDHLIKILTTLSKQKDVVINLETEKKYFYYTYALKLFIENRFPKFKVQIHPYLLAEGERIDDDHIELLLDQDTTKVRYKTPIYERQAVVSQVTQVRSKQGGHQEALTRGCNVNKPLVGFSKINIMADPLGNFINA